MLKRAIIKFNPNIRRHISSLYVTGDKAKENYVVLTPFLDFDEKLKDFPAIEENLEKRKMKFNMVDFKEEWNLFKTVEETKKTMEARRAEIAQIMKTKPDEALKNQGKMIREDMKLLRDNSYYLEDQFIHNYLRLPNNIHERTPLDEKKVIYSFLEDQKNTKIQNKGNMDELIEYYDPTCYYMKGEAAKFDLYYPMHVAEYFRENGYINFSNPDFTRSVIAEGAGIDPKDLYLLKEENIENKLNLLHLTGNASFLNYLSFITKLTVFPSLFPLKFICYGKQYNANNHSGDDLFNLVQSTCCETFISTLDDSTVAVTIDQQIEHLKTIYEKFNQHFRIVYYPAKDLKPSESLKVGVEMYSPSQEKYMEVGNFSYYGDFISKRLLFNYKVGKNFHFPHIFTGTTVNVMKLLVILIENCSEFKTPKFVTN